MSKFICQSCPERCSLFCAQNTSEIPTRCQFAGKANWERVVEDKPPSGWIKIESDKDLPPKGDYCVLVYRQKDNDYEIVHVNYFYSPYVAQKKFYQVTGVTHYKPLPKAPEVQS